LPFAGIRYSGGKAYQDKKLLDQEMGLDVSFRGQVLDRPQLYLNEARQSALALALYLGARLACAPQTTTHLKLLVLDDVLIGLDHANRLPVLDVLSQKFANWQVVLLTHDRGWFDLAREHLKTGWACYEMYEGDAAATATAPMPVVRKTESRPAPALLQKAKDLLALGYVEAAANYVRHAFEASMRGACEHKGIKLAFKQDLHALKSQYFLDGLNTWPGKPPQLTKPDWDAALARIELLKNVVMNPYSHPSAPNIPRADVQAAIDAVEAFLPLARVK
jgi:hypothetical protein